MAEPESAGGPLSLALRALGDDAAVKTGPTHLAKARADSADADSEAGPAEGPVSIISYGIAQQKKSGGGS